MIGSVRTNSAVRRLWKQAAYDDRFRYRHEATGISILDPTPTEDERVGDGYVSDGPRRLLRENWDNESLVLISRGLNLDHARPVTLILANQGRGIDAVVSQYLTSPNVSDWQQLEAAFGVFNFPTELPAEFQMVFRVELDGEDVEAQPISWMPLLY